MSNIKKILVLLLLSSCSPKVHVDRIHVHFYDHNTCEWSCLDMNDTIIPKKEWKEYGKNNIK
jgi:hypothetical protein